jgi:hypothetical protein
MRACSLCAEFSDREKVAEEVVPCVIDHKGDFPAIYSP